MIYKASNLLKEQLINLPETGMGYQILKLSPTPQYRMTEVTVFNSELLVDNDHLASSGITNFANDYDELLKSTELIINLGDLRVESVVRTPSSRNLFKSERSNCGRQTGGKGALENPEKYTDGDEDFVRVSHYRNDNRIDEVNNCLKKGAFTTSLKDYLECVYCPDYPNDRYALPNDDVIRWAFFITPIKFDRLQEGVVQPANNKNGGGYEAYFKDGTSRNTLKRIAKYGK